MEGSGHGFGPMAGIEPIENAVAKGVEPNFHARRAAGECGGARVEVDRLDVEAGLLKHAAVEGSQREEGCCRGFGVDAEVCEGGG